MYRYKLKRKSGVIGKCLEKKDIGICLLWYVCILQSGECALNSSEKAREGKVKRDIMLAKITLKC